MGPFEQVRVGVRLDPGEEADCCRDVEVGAQSVLVLVMFRNARRSGGSCLSARGSRLI